VIIVFFHKHTHTHVSVKAIFRQTWVSQCPFDLVGWSVHGWIPFPTLIRGESTQWAPSTNSITHISYSMLLLIIMCPPPRLNRCTAMKFSYYNSSLLGSVTACSGSCTGSRFWRHFKVAVVVNDVVQLGSCCCCSCAWTSCRHQCIVILCVTFTYIDNSLAAFISLHFYHTMLC